MEIRNKQNPNAGFTLIELIVALGLFAVVMTISMGAFLNISDIQKKSESLRNVSDNMSFTIEMMTRDIREGRDYICSPSPCDDLTFIDAEDDTVTYKLNKEDSQKKYIMRINSLGESSQITSNEVNVNSLIFTVRGTGPNDGQPFVTIYVGGVTDSKQKLKSSLNLQASVSQRKIDLNR
ncbi:MAG: type II secretion system protein [bacterium]|nr:type II secretion system protein [bacterium]